MDGMQMPYVAACFRARVVDRPKPAPPEPTPDAGDDEDGPKPPGTDDGRVTDDGSDPDVLLIDFR
jgi:hypothetical protein